MIKRQREGAAMSDPLRLEAGIQMMAAGHAETAISCQSKTVLNVQFSPFGAG